jgi:hypothetical protein
MSGDRVKMTLAIRRGAAASLAAASLHRHRASIARYRQGQGETLVSQLYNAAVSTAAQARGVV